MTQGRRPVYSDEPLAQWIRRHVEERGWQHKDLAAKLARSSRGRLGSAGAKRLVHAATKGTRPNQENLDLLAKVIGEPPPTDESALAQMHGRLEELAEKLELVQLANQELEVLNDELEKRVATLESQNRGAVGAPKRPRKAGPR